MGICPVDIVLLEFLPSSPVLRFDSSVWGACCLSHSKEKHDIHYRYLISNKTRSQILVNPTSGLLGI